MLYVAGWLIANDLPGHVSATFWLVGTGGPVQPLAALAGLAVARRLRSPVVSARSCRLPDAVPFRPGGDRVIAALSASLAGCRGRVSARPGGLVKIVVGLGNPGSQYAQTRHNIGWMVLDRLADRAGWSGRGRQRDAANVVMGRFRGLDVTLVKPLTYMNDSGLAVRKVLARDRAPLTDLLIVADDFALPFGKLRFREAGSHGGHNGLRSIVDELGTEKFSRLRVGIGDPNRQGADHVLSTFAPDERQRLDELVDAAADAVEEWAREGTNKAANRFNNFELRPADTALLAAPGEVDGPPGADGVRRTRTGWRRIRPATPGGASE